MKAAMRKRYVSVKAALDEAREAMATGKYGILAIGNLEKAEADAGKLLFEMLFSDQGDEEDLWPLLSKGSLLQMMYATVDARGSIQGRINQEKSREGMREKIKVLYDWLDQNIHKYHRRLARCAEDAVDQIPGIDMTVETVQKHITAYRKQKRLSSQVANKSSKIRKKRK